MTRPRSSTRLRTLAIALATAPLLVLLLASALLAQAQPADAEVATAVPPEVLQWGFMAAALVTGLSAIGAAYAVAVVGGAAMGAVAEKPEMAGRALVFVGLAEGIAIYGLIIAIMILGFLS
jgi:V/A-type H+/Na+-transporting ATPase subunit K